jgi:malonyl CoA-acyl carrier protein transacylase
MYLAIRLNTKTLTNEELKKVLEVAAHVATQIEIDEFNARRQVVILTDDKGKKLGEMGIAE